MCWCVAAGRDVRLWDDALRGQIYLGGEKFVERMQALCEPQRAASVEVPRVQRKARVSLQTELAAGAPLDQALRKAYVEGGATMTALAHEVGLSVSRVSRLIAAAERHLEAPPRTQSRQTDLRKS